MVAGFAQSAGADQSGLRNYSQARSVFWRELYPAGGEELYCGAAFARRTDALNIEHAFPAAWMVRHLECGSRAQCRRTSPRFNRMEADLHNLFPSRADVNSARANHPFGEIPGEEHAFAGCDVEIAGRGNDTVVEPRPAVRGDLARALLYMGLEYGVPADPDLQPLLVEWNRADPPTPAEIERNRRIERIQGNRNVFIDDPGVADRLDVAPASSGAGLRIATWNLGWLTERAAEINEEMRASGELREPIHQRTAADFRRLRGYADRLNADIVALQEVDSVAAAQRVFDPRKYDVVLTDETDYQRPGFAIRRELRYRNNGDLVGLDVAADRPRTLRRGADVTVDVTGTPLRLLSVHLKSGCFAPGVRNPEACQDLRDQIPILDRWIDQRQGEAVPFIVLGDFNRRFTERDPLWRAIDDGPAPLLRPTEDRRSPCWGGRHPEFIDHIVIDDRLSRSYVPGSLQVLVYAETERRFEQRLSDHCPVSMVLSRPR